MNNTNNTEACDNCICVTCADDQCSIYHCNMICKQINPVSTCDCYCTEIDDSELD